MDNISKNAKSDAAEKNTERGKNSEKIEEYSDCKNKKSWVTEIENNGENHGVVKKKQSVTESTEYLKVTYYVLLF